MLDEIAQYKFTIDIDIDVESDQAVSCQVISASVGHVLCSRQLMRRR